SIRSFGWGMSVLVYMLGTHADESNAILSEMGVSMVCPEIPAWTMLPWLLIFGFTRNYAGFITASWLMVSCQIPLMITFGLYFIGQHSWVGWKHIQAHLQMTHKRMWLHALPFHAMAWALLAVFFFFQTKNFAVSQLFTWGNVFIFLACMSTPHVLFMHLMYRLNPRGK
ncbi:MAG: Brp/Blh family beta-carotene 15,15'-dioxygenase, partial [Flavobacteriales bacterium]